MLKDFLMQILWDYSNSKLFFSLILSLIILNGCGSSSSSSNTETIVKSNSMLGINLEEVNDYTVSYPFVDHFKISRPWIAQNDETWDTEENLSVDENGWIKSLPKAEDNKQYTFAGTILFTADEHNMQGDYIVFYEGEGNVSYSLGATKEASLSAHGRDIVHLAADAPFYLKIIKTNPDNYIRNIKIIKEEDESIYKTEQFSKSFLKKLEGFSNIRFLNWTQTNSNSQKFWSDRPKELDATYGTDEGIPYEIIMDLVNDTNKNIWINIPTQATDNYVKQLAITLSNGLNENAEVYVEYSNEVWNAMFSQYDYAKEKSQDDFDSGDEFADALNWYGKHSSKLCEIFKNNFTNNSKVKCVMGSQNNDWVSEQVLSCPLWTEGSCSENMEILAIAPYFGIYLGLEENNQTVLNWTTEADGGLNKLFEELEHGGLVNNSDESENPKDGALNESFAFMTANKVIADKYNVKLMAYEGGQHLVGVGSVVENETISNLFITANKDPRMGTMYTKYLNGWRDNIGNLFNLYRLSGQSSKHGSFGLLENINHENSAKFDAVKEFMEDE
jgi:hypothetical protein